MYSLIYREPEAVLFLTGPRIFGILNLNLITEILILQALFDLLRENEWRQFAILTSFDTYGELGDVSQFLSNVSFKKPSNKKFY